MKKFNLQTCLLLVLVSATVAKSGAEAWLLDSYGDRFQVTYTDNSGTQRMWITAKVHADPAGIGYVFTDATTNKVIRVSGSVLIEPVE